MIQVGVALGNIQFLARGRIQEPSDSPNGVDHETAEFSARAGQVRLEQAVDETDREAEVGEEMELDLGEE